MSGTRIRWRIVAKVAGGAAALAVGVAVVPGLLEPAPPAPLPDDVGLATGASGPLALTPSPTPNAERGPRPHASRKAPHVPVSRDHGGRPKRPPPAERGSAHRQPSESAAEPAPTPGPSPTPGPPSTPAPAPAPAPAAAPPTPAPPPAPAPEPAPQPAGDGPADAGGSFKPDNPQGPAPFGFEH